jgi:hypothetical protein
VVKGPIPFFGKFFFHFLISLELCFLFFPFSFWFSSPAWFLEPSFRFLLGTQVIQKSVFFLCTWLDTDWQVIRKSRLHTSNRNRL